jgi:hypothetical protein
LQLALGSVVSDLLRQRATLNEFGHDETGEVLAAANIINRDNVGVIQIGDILGFGQVSFDIFGARNQLAVGHFDGNGTVELLILSLIDTSKAALAQELQDSVATDLRWHSDSNTI